MQRHLLSLATAAALLALHGQAHAAATAPDSAITAAGNAVTIDVAANDAGIGTPRSLKILTRPAHGTAVVVAGKIVYTPAAGYTGSDGFQYAIKGTRNTGIGSVRVDVGLALTLRGRVTDAPVANATVVATVGGHDFTTTADAQGNYTLQVIGLGDPMVALSAQGTGEQDGVMLLSTVGGFGGLRDAAGADGVLDRSEANAVQVTQLSTAQALLMEAANGGEPIATDAQLTQAREHMDLDAMMTMAGAIKLVADGQYALPAGVTDTLALISDPAALDQFVADVHAADPGALAAAQTQTLLDPAVVTPLAADDFGGEFTLMHDLGKVGTVRVGLIQGERVELDPDGTGIYASAAPNSDPSVTWTFSNGAGHIVRNHPVATLNYVVVPEIGPFQIRRFDTLKSFDVVLVAAGEGRDILGVTGHYDYYYPDHPQLSPGSYTDSSSKIAITDGYGNIPYSSAEFPSVRALPISGTSYSNSSGAVLFDFLAGGTGQRSDGVAFDWSLDPEGRIFVTYANGDLARFNRLATDGRKGEGVLAETLTAGGVRSARWELSMRADGYAFGPTGDYSAPWHSGFYISPGAYQPSGLDFYVFLTGAASTGHLLTYSGGASFIDPLSWTRTAGSTLRMAQYRDNGGYKASCVVGVDGCVQTRAREWIPVARDGNRVYVIEQLKGDYNSDGVAGEIDNERPNFYDLQAPPAP
jgi:hypothetical protein